MSLDIYGKKALSTRKLRKTYFRALTAPPPTISAGPVGHGVFFGSSWGHTEELPAIKFWARIFSWANPYNSWTIGATRKDDDRRSNFELGPIQSGTEVRWHANSILLYILLLSSMPDFILAQHDVEKSLLAHGSRWYVRTLQVLTESNYKMRIIESV